MNYPFNYTRHINNNHFFNLFNKKAFCLPDMCMQNITERQKNLQQMCEQLFNRISHPVETCPLIIVWWQVYSSTKLTLVNELRLTQVRFPRWDWTQCWGQGLCWAADHGETLAPLYPPLPVFVAFLLRQQAPVVPRWLNQCGQTFPSVGSPCRCVLRPENRNKSS